MIINLVRIDAVTGERKEVFNLTSEKIKEYAVKAGTFVLVNGLLGKVLPARRNLTKIVNAAMAAGITKLIFDKIEEDPSKETTVETCDNSSNEPRINYSDEVEDGYVKLTPRDDVDDDVAVDEKVWEDEDIEVKEDADRGLEGDWRSHD